MGVAISGEGRVAPASLETPPYRVEMPSTGELFEFVASARSAPDGKFRFVWTLAPGKRGPGEHYHEGETEVFAVVSGTLRIWLDGVARDLGPGESVVVEPGVAHRFLNPGQQPVVVDVSLDGPRMEDTLVPLSVATHGRKPRMGDVARMIAGLGAYWPSTPTSAVGCWVIKALSGMLRLLGARPFERVYGWDAPDRR